MGTLDLLCRILRRKAQARDFRPFRCCYSSKFKYARPDGSGRGKSPGSTLMPSTPARTRFAPSPTGYLHLGSLRTALYNYLLARATGGQFLLRLEDTDRTRLVDDAEKRLYEDLRWAGLDWDEGPDKGGPYGPYIQSDRLSVYRGHMDTLLKNGHAYRCFCTAEELDRMRQEALTNGSNFATGYNRKCLHIPTEEAEGRAARGEPHCIRFNSGDGKAPILPDLVYGSQQHSGKVDDFVLMKQDGYPTYHFANVVDDHEMHITHVIRGAEWLISTPKHLSLYNAFGWQAPQFAHVGLLTNAERQKLSKRNGNVDISVFRDQGLLPVSLLNYVVLLGWNPMAELQKERTQVMDLQQMVDQFHLRFTKGDIRVNAKLPFFQAKHLGKLPFEEFVSNVLPPVKDAIRRIESRRLEVVTDPELDPIIRNIGPLISQARVAIDSTEPANQSLLIRLLELNRGKYKDPVEWLEHHKYLIWEIPPQVYQDALKANIHELAGPHLLKRVTAASNAVDVDLATRTVADSPKMADEADTAATSEVLQRFTAIFASIPEGKWEPEAIQDSIMSQFDLKNEWSALLRWVLTAYLPGPGLAAQMWVLGKDRTMGRLADALAAAKSFSK